LYKSLKEIHINPYFENSVFPDLTRGRSAFDRYYHSSVTYWENLWSNSFEEVEPIVCRRDLKAFLRTTLKLHDNYESMQLSKLVDRLDELRFDVFMKIMSEFKQL